MSPAFGIYGVHRLPVDGLDFSPFSDASRVKGAWGSVVQQDVFEFRGVSLEQLVNDLWVERVWVDRRKERNILHYDELDK